MKVFEIEFNSDCKSVYIEASSLLEAMKEARERFTNGLYESIEGIKLRCNILESIGDNNA